MFGLKSKLKPRVKPSISVNKASKSDENKNDEESPVADNSLPPTPPDESGTSSPIVRDDSATSVASLESVEVETVAPLSDKSIETDSENIAPNGKSEPQTVEETAPTKDNLSPWSSPSESDPGCSPSKESIDLSRANDQTPNDSNSINPSEKSSPKAPFKPRRKPALLLRVKRKPTPVPQESAIPSSEETEPLMAPPESKRPSIEPIPSSEITPPVCDKMPEMPQPIAPQIDQEVKNKSIRPHVFKPTLDRQRTPKFTTSTYGKMSLEAKATMLRKFGTTTPDPSKLTMLDLIFYNPKISGTPKKPEKDTARLAEVIKLKIDSNENSDAQKENSNKPKPDSQPMPKIKLDGSGRAVVDSESIIIRNKAPDDVDAHEFVKPDKRTSCKRKRENNFWNYEETLRFYKALLKHGSDFSMMQSEFPERDRKSLKSKFKREEKTNGKLIDKVIGAGSHQFDVDTLESELSTTHGSSDHSKKKNLRAKVKKCTEGVKSTVIGRRKQRKVSKIIDDGDDSSPRKKLSRSFIKNFITADRETDDENSLSDSSVTYNDNSDDERASVVSEVAREEFIKEFLENGKVVLNTSIVSNSAVYTHSIRIDSNREQPLDVNLTLSHSVPEQRTET